MPVGKRKDRNGSGVDFFFMHRHMLGTARSLQDLPSWTHFPLPQPELARDRQGFANYFDNHDGTALPPTWLAEDDADYSQWVSDIKTAETYHSNFQVWESQYRDPRYLSKFDAGAVRFRGGTGFARLAAHALGLGAARPVQRPAGAVRPRSGGFLRALVCAGKRLSW
jgi:hypothetical protein